MPSTLGVAAVGVLGRAPIDDVAHDPEQRTAGSAGCGGAAGSEHPGHDHPECVTTDHPSDLQAAPMTNGHLTSNTNKSNERSDEMRDPTKDEYLELEKRLGAAEYALAAGIAAENKASNDAMEAARERAGLPIGEIRDNRRRSRG